MAEKIKNYEKVNLNIDYNNVSKSTLGLDEPSTMIFDDYGDVYNSSAQVIEHVDVLTSNFTDDAYNLGATVKDVSSLESLAGTFVK